MSIHFELKEIPVPANARSDGSRVYVNVNSGNGRSIKVYIGVYARKDDGTFYPNDKFRYYFPSLWEKHYSSQEIYPHVLGIGLYGATLAISQQTGLYDALYECFGPLYANAMLDYAMYSVKERSNVANLFKPAMASSAVFSKDRNDDGWYSDIFGSKITKTMIHRFKETWIKKCKESGVKKVWLAIDGSNSNCEANTPLARSGKAKSHENVPIVSYIWAVSAADGMPVSFFMNEGSTVDSKAFMEICAFIAGYGFGIEGVILDRGFLTHDALQTVKKSGYDYVVKLKNDTWALAQMFEKHWGLVYWNPEQLVSKGARFGVATCEPEKIFSVQNDKAYVAMYFDGKNGSERRVALVDKIFDAMEKIREQAEAGKKPEIDGKMARYLLLVEEKQDGTGNDKKEKEEKEDFQASCGEWAFSCEDRKYKISVNKTSFERDLKLKGIEGLASSRKMTAREMDAAYNLRDVSEKQYMVSKSMLGNRVFRAHSTQGIESREAVCFIAAIIRSSFKTACQTAGRRTARAIEELDEKAYLLLMSNGNYTFINKMTDGMKAVLKKYGLTAGAFEILAGDINERMHARGIGVSQYHEMPGAIKERYQKKNSREEKRETEEKPAVQRPVQDGGADNTAEIKVEKKRQPGRPKGSRNKSTIAREEKERAMGITPPERKRRGRPIGSKDSKPRTRRTKAQMLEEALISVT